MTYIKLILLHVVLARKTASSALNYQSMKDNFVDIAPVIVLSANGTSLESPSTFWDEQNKSCNQAVQYLSYNISIDSGGSIIGIQAIIHVVNLSSGTSVTQQGFSTVFSSFKMTRRSGNPGYIVGAPLLAGKINESSGGVDLSFSGLTVSDTGKFGGDCLATSKSHVR